MVPNYLGKIELNRSKAPKNVHSRGRPNTFFSLVTTAIISIHSYKISRDCFTFLKTLSNIPKIGPKILPNAPQQRNKCCEVFLNKLTVRIIQKTPV